MIGCRHTDYSQAECTIVSTNVGEKFLNPLDPPLSTRSVKIV